jgi:amino acid transporter
VLRVDINGKVLAVLLCTEIAIVLIYDYGDLAHPGPAGITFDTLMPSNLFVTGFGAVLVLTLLGFTGFESSVVFSEESKNPKRTIAMATYLSVAIIGVTYAVSAWAMSVATGPENIVQVSTENGPFTIFGLASGRLPNFLVDVGGVLFATSVLAAAISFHNTVARYTFALGRERVFPGFLSATGRRSGAPIAGSLLQSIVGLAVIVFYAWAGLDPVFQLMFWIGTAGGFGVLVLLALTSLAVVAFFVRESHGENVWRRLIAPAISIPVLGAVIYFAVINFDLLLAVPPEHPGESLVPTLAWVVPAAFPAIGLLGILWALVLRSTRRDVYNAIGLGANSVTGLATQSTIIPAQHAARHGSEQDQNIYR